METLNVGADTWRLIDQLVASATDWSLGQIIHRLEQAMEEHPEASADIAVAIARIEQELDQREIEAARAA